MGVVRRDVIPYICVNEERAYLVVVHVVAFVVEEVERHRSWRVGITPYSELLCMHAGVHIVFLDADYGYTLPNEASTPQISCRESHSLPPRPPAATATTAGRGQPMTA